jgi:3'(2'), 5'-bisphosphate nucleotidase
VLSTTDDVLAHDLAKAAGQRLLALRAAGGEPRDLRAAGDRLSHEFLIAQLALHRTGDAVLSEEGKDDERRLTARRVWIVDPLDGTREFGEPGRTDWAVHVALWNDGELTAGAVALPAQQRVLSTSQGAVAASAPPSGQDSIRMVVSRSRPPEFVHRLADSLGAVQLPLGSAGAKTAAVLMGDADAYVHSGGQYEWDSAAPAAVALAAGFHASRIDGSKLLYNQPSPYIPDLLICRAALASRILQAIAATPGAR